MIHYARRLLLVGWLMLGVGAGLAQEAGETANENATPQETSLAGLPVSMESQPYTVRIEIASALIPQAEMERQIAVALERSVGTLWKTEITELAGLSRIDGEALRRWTLEEVREKFSADESDFCFAVTVERRGSQWIVAARAWQPRFEWLSPVHVESFYEPREAAGRALKLCWGLFRPEILIEHADQNNVRIRIRAGDLQPADPAYRLFQPGECLVPWLLYYDRDKKLKRRQELPWTYVRLDAIQGPLATGTVLSGLRTPLAGKTRGKIDKVAVAARPVFPDTRLQIGVQNQPSRLLAGYRLELRPKLPVPRPVADPADKQAAKKEPPPEEEADVIRLLSDRLGEARLAPVFDQAMTWIYIYSGDLMLARVPFVPGSVAFARLDVPDDSIRLQVEGELQIFQGELINLVAQRNTLIAGIRTAAKRGDWNRAALLRTELDNVAEKKTFTDRLAAIRVTAVNAAKARKDRNGQVRVERLCKDVGELIDRYLDPEKLRLIKDELDELKKAVKDAPP